MRRFGLERASATRGDGLAAGEQPIRLGDLLVEHGLVSRSQLSEALLQQSASGKRIGTLLVELGAIDDEDLVLALSDQLKVPIADLHLRAPSTEALDAVPESVARSVVAIPLAIDGDTLEVAMADPSKTESIEALREASGCGSIVASIASSIDIERVIDSAYRALIGIDEQIDAFAEIERRRRSDRPELEVVTEDSPVVAIVNMIVTQAQRDRASDIHLEPTQDRVRLRFRIDGALHDIIAFPGDMGPALVSRIKILAGMNIVERRRPQDGQITMSVDGKELDVRVSTAATIWGEKAVLRLLGKSTLQVRLRDLGMPGFEPEPKQTSRADGTNADENGSQAAEPRPAPASSEHPLGIAYREVIRSPFGMLVVAGPTGSGKTTTLYATVSEINRSERNIMTIEDPVEYVLPSVNQLQINEAADVTFAAGLKSILRQDPDVILVGEIRDAETARLAVQSALTGHFVLSTIHATDAASGLQRFLDMGIEPFIVASSMQAMMSQRLVRRVCKHCRVRYEPSTEELAFFDDSGGIRDGVTFERGEGCNFCSRTGFRERIGVFELLRINDEIKGLILDKAPHHELRASAVRDGMVPMRTAAMELVAQGVTTIDEVLRSIYLL